MLSMSGFGSGKSSNHGHHYHVECASINRKGLEILVTLPRALASLETSIREEVQQQIKRGRIHICVSDERAPASKNKPALFDKSAAAHAFSELRQLQQNLNLSGDITLAMLLRVPGVLSGELSEEIDLVSAWKALQGALKKALQALLVMKTKEGKHLLADLKKRFLFLEQATKKIKARVPLVLEHRRTQLQARLASLGVPLAESDPSFIRELTIFSERSDISEEITRLQSHFAQARAILASKTEGARTLDYLAQEMFREFNTISNKANDAEISHLVVQSKSELDKIREQLANLE